MIMKAPISSSELCDSKIIEELVENRTENIKHFITENHGGVAVMYPEAVHYSEGGKWKDIDNSLEEDYSNSVYQNKASGLKVKFAKHGTANKLVSLHIDNNKLSWGLESVGKSKSKDCVFQLLKEEPLADIDKSLDNPIEEWNNKKMKVEHICSGGFYENIFDGITITYKLEGKILREIIAIANKNAVDTKISFRIRHKKMGIRLGTSGGAEVFKLDEPDTVVYFFSAPCMYDSAGNFSEKTSYKIEEAGKEESVLNIVTDSEWMNAAERIYPIIIDPDTETSHSSKNIVDTFVRQIYPASSVVSSYGSFYVANNNGYGICRSFLKFASLPVIPGGAVIYNARLNIWQYGYSSYQDHGFYVTAHKVNSGWVPGSTTWNNQPACESEVLDYAKMEKVTSGSTLYITPKQFNVTKLVREWYNTGINNGIMLKMQDESIRAESVFVSSDHPTGGTLGITSDMFPAGIIYYRDANGLEDYYSYHTQSAGRTGEGHVNDFNGNLVFVHSDTTISGSCFPVTLSHVYNLSQRDEWERVGFGWRLSAHQKLQSLGIEHFPYVYTDGDGTKHYFYKDTEDGNKLKDEEGIGFTITQTSSLDSQSYMVMETKEHIKISFRQDGWISKEIDSNGNSITYHYAADQWGDRLVQIENSTGSKIFLVYGTDGKLDSLTDEVGRKVYYHYEDRKLCRITYPDGEVSQYMYNGHELIGVRAIDGYELHYTYVQDCNVRRIGGIMEKGGNVSGQEVKISYYNGTSTVFEETELKGNLGDSRNSKKYTYQFDTNGRAVCVCDENGNAANYSFFKQGQKNNKLSSQGNTMKTVINYVLNCRFEESLNWWEIYSIDKSQVEVDTTQGYIGNKSVKITRTSTGNNASGVLQTVNLKPGTYTASAYFKIQDITGAEARMGIAIIGIKKDGTNVYLPSSPGLREQTDDSIDQGWKREYVTFVINEAYQGVAIVGAFFNGAGVGWVSCFQLEEGRKINPLNIMENGSFEVMGQATDTIPVTFGSILTNNVPGGDGQNSEIYKYDSHSLRIYGEVEKRKGFWKKIPISGSEKDIFSISGWAKGKGVPGKEFSMVIGIEYEDNTVKWTDIPFNPNVSEWQFVSQIVSANDQISDTEKRYKSILFYIFFGNNANDAFFDGIQIIRDDAESYVYDNAGNLISTKSAAEKSGFSYDKNNDISKAMDISGTSFEYGYDDKHNMVYAVNSEQVEYQFQYDMHGNPIKINACGGKFGNAVTPGKTYYIRERVSGNCIGTLGSSTAAGTSANLWEYTAALSQKWKIVDVGSGYVNIILLHAPKMALEVKDAADAEGAKVQINSRNNGDSQKFKIQVMRDGSYHIIAKCSKDKRCLTNASNSTANGELITTWAINNDYDRQKWYFESAYNNASDVPENKKVYEMRIMHSNMYLDVSGKSSEEGTHLVQYYGNATDAQKFVIVHNDDAYTIHPIYATEKALTVNQNSQGQDEIVIKAYEAGYIKQKFQFVKCGNASAISHIIVAQLSRQKSKIFIMN